MYSSHVRNISLKTSFRLVLLFTGLALMGQNLQDAQSKVRVLEEQAQQYLQERKPGLAIPILREILSLDPKNVNAQANLGVLLFFESKYAEAIPHLRTALELRPDLWRVEALLGIAEKRSGDGKDGQKDLEQAFSNLTEVNIRMEAGLELIGLDCAFSEFDKALSIASKLQEIAPQNPRVLLASYQIARQMMDQTLLNLIVAAPDSAEAHMIMASELGRQGDHSNAIAQYQEAIRLNPMLPGAHFELAEQLRTSSDPALNAQAEGEYKAALKVNQYDELSWRQLGRIMAAKGDFKTAEYDYRNALALQPNDSDAKTGLAIVFIATTRTKEAITLLESAIRDDPTNIVAHYRLSMLYRREGRLADSQREMDAFRHYQTVKSKLGKIFKQLQEQPDPM